MIRREHANLLAGPPQLPAGKPRRPLVAYWKREALARELLATLILDRIQQMNSRVKLDVCSGVQFWNRRAAVGLLMLGGVACPGCSGAQRKSRSRASSPTLSPDKTGPTIGGCGKVCISYKWRVWAGFVISMRKHSSNVPFKIS
jgi:hypothetical protein